MLEKIRPTHRQRTAIIYVRQSTLNQVRMNQESTERQYALQTKAVEMGWPEQAIEVIDEDLGLSGSHSTDRKGFQKVVARVSLGQVGVIFGLEVSRLARSSADWHRLLELCALFDTLIADADGIYDLADFNDRLVLGLKGTMSEAELHVLRGRLWGGKLNKARKGELHSPLPVGFIYDPQGCITLDPNEEVQHAIRSLFVAFQETGSAFGVVQSFSSKKRVFPKRAYGGAWAGQLLWGPLTHGRVLGILKNPTYAGTYVFGRYRYRRSVTAQGQITKTPSPVPPDEWYVRIDNHHPGYISLVEFEANQARLMQNRTNAVLSGPAREGSALLQGLLLCGHCGHRLTVRYTGNGGINPSYECSSRHHGKATALCRSVSGPVLDKAVSDCVLAALQPEELELALQAVDQMHQIHLNAQRSWQLRLERARYEADRAERQYMLTEPENRLVARTLEAKWNECLKDVTLLEEEFRAEQQRMQAKGLLPSRDRILAIAQDLPSLWNAETTTPKHRKRILRLLLSDVTVINNPDGQTMRLGIRWRSGRVEEAVAKRPLTEPQRTRCSTELCEVISELARDLTDAQIAATCNARGILSPRGRPFTVASVKWIRYRYHIPGPTIEEQHELTVAQTAALLGVSAHMIYYWIQHGHLVASKRGPGWPWRITLDSKTEESLRCWISGSGHLKRNP